MRGILVEDVSGSGQWKELLGVPSRPITECNTQQQLNKVLQDLNGKTYLVEPFALVLQPFETLFPFEGSTRDLVLVSLFSILMESMADGIVVCNTPVCEVMTLVM